MMQISTCEMRGNPSVVMKNELLEPESEKGILDFITHWEKLSENLEYRRKGIAHLKDERSFEGRKLL